MRVRGQEIVPPKERIARMVETDPETGCWNWTGNVHSPKKPYGLLTVGSRSDGGRRTVRAHRYSYAVHRGDFPDDMLVCHHCDNPRCVNPDHLFLGTKKTNADDRDAKGRNKLPPRFHGSLAPWSKLSDAEVEEIRQSPLHSKAIAPKYGVHDSYVRQIRRGLYRSDPTPPPPATEGDSQHGIG